MVWWAGTLVALYTAWPGPGTWLTPIIVIAGLRSASIITVTQSLTVLTDMLIQSLHAQLCFV